MQNVHPGLPTTTDPDTLHQRAIPRQRQVAIKLIVVEVGLLQPRLLQATAPTIKEDGDKIQLTTLQVAVQLQEVAQQAGLVLTVAGREVLRGLRLAGTQAVVLETLARDQDRHLILAVAEVLVVEAAAFPVVVLSEDARLAEVAVVVTHQAAREAGINH